MIKCGKCNAVPSEKDIIGWKCNSCGKAFKVSKSKLHSIFMKKSEDPERSYINCPSCKNSLDDGNERIVWKCSCGNTNMGKLKDFGEEVEAEQAIFPKSNLIKCPECGMEISSKAKKCVHCGKVFVEDQLQMGICVDCGREVPSGVTECPHCGCPIESQSTFQNRNRVKMNINKNRIVIPVISVIVLCVIGIAIYNIKVIKPQKMEAQNKELYEEAVGLLEKGKYEDGNELLQTITGYKDVDLILEQIKWESYTYECINDFKTWLKNPDSFTLYEVAFYLDDEPHGIYGSLLGEADFSYPAIVFRSGGQNGFGGNTTGYELFYYFKDKGYTCVGSCDSLDENEYYNDKGELKDEDDGAMDVLLCKEINELREKAEQVGEVDMDRLKSIIKNDSYSTIKIIE